MKDSANNGVTQMSAENNYNQYELEYVRPWDMPIEVWWDKSEGAHIRRGQWVVDNRPEVSLDELSYRFALHPDEIDQLVIPLVVRTENQA